ncbi:MAG: hypothetical protein RPT11_02905 [Bermanella sp.]
MDLQILSDLRVSVRAALVQALPDVPLFSAELNSIDDGEGGNLEEFMTLFFADGDEDRSEQDLDGDSYRAQTLLTLGYFNEQARMDQALLDAQAAVLRPLLLAVPFAGYITRAGWQYVSPLDGATAGIYFRFDVTFSH